MATSWSFARAIERERGAAPSYGVSPRKLAKALNWMSERMLFTLPSPA